MTSSDKPGILIVDDDTGLSTLTKTILCRKGYDVVGTVSTAREVFGAVVGAAPDLVLMDINLGTTFDGIDAANYVYHCFHTPVVFLTGTTDRAAVERAKTAEPFGYVTKPFSRDGLCAAIEEAYAAFQTSHPEVERIRRQYLEALAGKDGYLLLDDQGAVVYMNGYAEYLAGVPHGSVFLNPLGDVVKMEACRSGAGSSQQNLFETFETLDRSDRHPVVQFVSRQGEVKTARLNVRSFRGRDGRVVGSFLHLKDLSGTTL